MWVSLPPITLRYLDNMAEEFSLGEAIGLQGRFNIAEQTAQGGIAAINARVKAAQKRAKEDEDFYNRILEKTQTPKYLHHLFVEPAATLGVDAAARIAKAKANGGEAWRTEAANIANELSQSYAELQNRSQVWKSWEDNYNRGGNYRTRAQAALKSAADNAKDYNALRERAIKENIPGYDVNNDMLDERVTYFAPRQDVLGVMNKEFSVVKPLEGKATVKKIAGKDQISQEKIIFLYDKDAQDYAKLNNLDITPSSIESTARNLLATQPAFRYQYADELGVDPLDDNTLLENMVKVGAKYVAEQEKLKSAGQDINISVYNSLGTKGTPAAVNKRIGRFSDSKNTYVNFGSGVVQIKEIQSFTPTGDTVDSKGVLRRDAISNVTPQEVVVLPYVYAQDEKTKRTYEKPLIIGETDALSKLDLRKADGFQAYIKMSTATGIIYVAADGFQDVQYVSGSEEVRNAQVGTLTTYKSLGDKMNKYHGANRQNGNAVFYKLWDAYSKNPTSENEKALNAFIDSNF